MDLWPHKVFIKFQHSFRLVKLECWRLTNTNLSRLVSIVIIVKKLFIRVQKKKKKITM